MKKSLKSFLFILSLLLLSGSFVLSGDTSIPLIERLASPEFEGRGVGTAGLDKARDLLVSELANAGFTPGFLKAQQKDAPPVRSYTQDFRVFVGNDVGPANSLERDGGGVLKLSDDFVPLAYSKSGSVRKAQLVFAGFGISLRSGGEAVYDDYEGIDVQGKIVLVLLGDPAAGSQSSVFRNPAYYQYSTPMYKVQNAELHGAAGVILVRDPLSVPGEGEAPLKFQSRQGGGATSDLLAVQIRLSAAERLAGRSFLELQKRIADTQKPASFVMDGSYAVSVELSRHLGSVQNVAALIPGTDPALANEYYVIGAHYDHLGYGGDSSMDPNGIGKVHPGADDNASGVQAVMDLAKRIKAGGANKHPVLALFFSAEEIGLLGSKEFTDNLPIPENAKVVGMINLDMVGRLKDNKLSVLALKSAKEFDSVVENANRDSGFDLIKADSGFGSSDHASFLQLKIPALFFTTGAHEDYHRPTDTADKINGEGLRRVEDFAFAVFGMLDNMGHAPTYDPDSEDSTLPSRPGRGYGVYFGSIPEFSQGGDIQGVLLQGVKVGSPAEKAGLLSGDIVTGLGEIKVKNLYDLVFALRFYRPNEEVLVTWTRAGQPMQAKVILLARE